MKRTAAVIVTYNRKAMLQRCLRALCTQTAGVPELWVIDNASTDGTAELVAQLNLPTMHYYNTGKNLGGAGGFACGIQQAACSGAEYLWIMDDDCLPEPDALQQLLLADAELDGQYGWLSSRALAPDGKDQPMNLQRSTPYKDLASFAGPRQPAVMASFVSLFLRSSTVQRFGLPIAVIFYLVGRLGVYPPYLPQHAVLCNSRQPGGACNAERHGCQHCHRYPGPLAPLPLLLPQ